MQGDLHPVAIAGESVGRGWYGKEAVALRCWWIGWGSMLRAATGVHHQVDD